MVVALIAFLVAAVTVCVALVVRRERHLRIESARLRARMMAAALREIERQKRKAAG